MFSVAETLKRFWLRQNIKLNAGASEAQLATFERKHNVRLPRDLRGYFATVNGFDCSAHWMTDENVIEFLSLNEVKPVSEYWSSDVVGADSYFVFADYSISAHVYAIRLLKDSENMNTVAVVYDAKPIEVANSFTRFVEEYLSDNKAILFPDPQA